MALIILERERKIKRIDSLSSVDTDIEVATADSIDESFVFIFWINHDNIMSEHETTENFELHSERLTSS